MSNYVDYVQTIKKFKQTQNRRIRQFQSSVLLKMDSLEEQEDGDFYFNLNYCVARTGLSRQAEDELREIEATANEIQQIGDVLVEVTVNVLLLDDVLGEMWKQGNQFWRTSSGQNEEWINLYSDGNVIDDGKCSILFCRGIDLINAYEKLGHRLFSPNVRCYLQDTPVNTRIREAVRTVKGISSFKYFNNGVTIIAESIEKKGQGRVRLRKPGAGLFNADYLV